MLRSLAFGLGMTLVAGLLAAGFVLEAFASGRPSSFRRRLGALLVLFLAVVLIDVVGGGQR